MKELITRIEELAVQVVGAQLQIDKSEAESRELGRELGKARQRMMELVNERDHALAQVPLEGTREALKNAVEKLQEVTTDRDRVLNELGTILAEANKSGRCNGDPVALIKQGQNDLDALRAAERDAGTSKRHWIGISNAAARNGLRSGEDVMVFIERKCSELAGALQFGGRMQERANERGRALQKLTECNSKNVELIAEIEKTADTCGRTEGESVVEFMKRVKQETRYT